MMVRAQAILTQLVFDHAMRIRMKAETSPEATSTSTSTTSTAVATPESASVAETRRNEEHAKDGDTAASKSQTAASTKGTKAVTSPKASSTMPKAAAPKAGKGKGGNMIGKINNLVTSDLQNLIAGSDFLLLGTSKCDKGCH